MAVSGPRPRQRTRAVDGNVIGRSFSLMLAVKRELLQRMTILRADTDTERGAILIPEGAEDDASALIEKAIIAAERRGERRQARLILRRQGGRVRP